VTAVGKLMLGEDGEDGDAGIDRLPPAPSTTLCARTVSPRCYDPRARPRTELFLSRNSHSDHRRRMLLVEREKLRAALRPVVAAARLLLCALAIGVPGTACALEPLFFGAFPRWSPQATVRDFTPLARLMGKVLGREVQVDTDKDFESFMRRAKAGEFQLVHLNQLQYLQVSRAGRL
jgi:hypothetical protein